MLLLIGCVSQIASVDRGAKSWLGFPLSKLKQRVKSDYAKENYWLEETISLDDGNTIYKDPVREGCLIIWTANTDGILIDYRTEGNRCY